MNRSGRYSPQAIPGQIVGVPACPGLISAALFLSLAGCGALSHGFLAAQGPVAEHERHLFITVCIVLLFVIGPVLLLTPLFAWHYRLSNRDHAYRPDWRFSWPIEGLIWLPPIGIVIGLAVLLWNGTKLDDPYTRLKSRVPPIEVQAVALDWKWLFIYPDRRVASVNELAVPVGRPVHMRLTSGSVMQSLLMPQLAGQIYAMAGMSTQMNVQADRPGTYLGENVQYNGAGFQAQKFRIVALTPEPYRSWLARAAASGRPLDAAAWQKLQIKSVVGRPIYFSPVPTGFYEQVVAGTGGRSHPHPKDAR